MNELNARIDQLRSNRNKYGGQSALKKMHLLHAIKIDKLNSKQALRSFYDSLLFLIAYPDNKNVEALARSSLIALQQHIVSNQRARAAIYNSGITGSSLCAAFSFEMVKWMRKKYPAQVRLSSFEADDAQLQAILSVVMSKTESEILQDANAEWKGWLKRWKTKGEGLLDQLIAIFDSTTIRPEVKDELWNTIGVNTEIDLPTHCCLPDRLVVPYYHRSLNRRHTKQQPAQKPVKVKLSDDEADQIIDCSRMILVRHLREIDPVSFTSTGLVDYYQLGRGLSIALTGMVPDRRHPVDSYIGYVVFKNGLPVGYAASWILFDSARIGLNIFPSYRGGESQYIFQQALQLHRLVYNLRRFSVDPYQLGKENSDGIHSGVFWVYYHAGFRPILGSLKELAAAEVKKIKTTAGYRTPASILEKLASGRLELVMDKTAVSFDATDLSITWMNILAKKYNNDRNAVKDGDIKRIAALLKIKDHREPRMNFILQNWALFLVANETALKNDTPLKQTLAKIFELKANGSEEEYIRILQQANGVRKLLENVQKL
jgi:hypothetical protein